MLNTRNIIFFGSVRADSLICHTAGYWKWFCENWIIAWRRDWIRAPHTNSCDNISFFWCIVRIGVRTLKDFDSTISHSSWINIREKLLSTGRTKSNENKFTFFQLTIHYDNNIKTLWAYYTHTQTLLFLWQKMIEIT